MHHKIKKVDVHLVSAPVTGGLADATREVETIGFVIVRVTTNQGLEGFGVTYHEVGGEATCELISRNMTPKLIGRDPLETEAIWQDFFHYLRGIGRKGLMYCALSAVDIALWDIKGKIVDLPIYRLLGGNRTTVPVYASGGWTSYSDDELIAEMKGMVARGFKTIKFKVGFNGGLNPRRDVERVRKVRRQSARISICSSTPTTPSTLQPPCNWPIGFVSSTSPCLRSRSSRTTFWALHASSAARISRWPRASTSTLSSACAIS
jgi:L-alanine-DL-glutamate epimerase-like enolase superfamily enzyme